ncbi:MAG: ParB/RepB/Spo0J family partition protein [Anaerolineales bacterium]|nr:ParB/RepB/Spo0J family partition protein [Anaerolineales bacterium]
MAKRTGLGKGLDALIPGGQPSRLAGVSGEAGIKEVDVQTITPNPHQPRTHFDPNELQELADSILEHGVIQPLIVTANGNGQYTLIAGERRLKASKEAGLPTVPVVIRNVTEQQMLAWALIENVQRADLSPLEEAEAYHQLTDEFNLSHEEIAKQVGKSRTAVTNTLRLRNLSETVKQALVDKRISEGHARALLGLSNAQSQASALKTVIDLRLNVRQTEGLVRKLSGEKPAPKEKTAKTPEVAEIESRLRSSLGTKVSLRHGAKGGNITIHYYSDEELDALLERLL